MTTLEPYDQLIASKVRRHESAGFKPHKIKAALFDWQKLVVEWAIRKGRCALFEDCGLGKTAQQLEWARQVSKHCDSPVLILCPLAVAEQTVAEGDKFGIRVNHCRQPEQVKAGVNITNYERLHLFEDLGDFAGVVLDESSILKSFDGKTRRMLTERFAQTPYRLCCTATPAPNDFTELGQHADFLGICTPAQMLATYFINDTFDTGTWRLKGHSVESFWRWVASWAACISKPSDLGFSDDGYELPPINVKTITVAASHMVEEGSGMLFRDSSVSATNLHKELRVTMAERVAKAAEIVNTENDHWVVWCESNQESRLLAESIPDAVEVTGADTPRYKEAVFRWFVGLPLDEKDLALIGNRTKLTPWHEPDTSKNTTPKTEQSGSVNQSRISKSIDKNGSSICSGITKPMLQNGPEERQSNGSDIIGQGGSGTLPIQVLEMRQENKLRSGRGKTHRSEKHSDSRNLGYLSQSSSRFCESNLESAPSAANPSVLETSPTLTTAIRPEGSVGCSAPHAISDLESSEIIRNFSTLLSSTSRRVLISKPSIFGFGANFQHCRNEIYVGMTHSYERFYQASKRIHRFGQKREVNRYIVQTDTMGNVMAALQRKQDQHDTMREFMRFTREEITGSSQITIMNTEITTKKGNGWTMHHGDCVRVAKTLADNSIGCSVFSPPFADLFTYSSDVQDMGNCGGLDEFMQQFGFLVDELLRVTMPGRECCVHCNDLLATKWKDGEIEFKDFSGSLVSAFRSRGWLLHSRITIWKDPVTEMQRTKAHGLLYKTLRSDSSKSRVGAPEYLLVFRKPGDNPKPITHSLDDIPLPQWQELASPVWMTIDQGNVLNGKGASEDKDERHICPLQLDVIKRALTLWSAPDDLVFSPFSGIGSEGYVALQMGRKFVGAELKESYFNTACENLARANEQCELFSMAA